MALGDHTRRHRDAGWLLALLGSGFLVSWLATDVGHTPRSRYILVLAVVTAALTGGYLAPRTPPGWTTTGPGVVAAWIVALVASGTFDVPRRRTPPGQHPDIGTGHRGPDHGWFHAGASP